jgi:hypothetical protein
MKKIALCDLLEKDKPKIPDYARLLSSKKPNREDIDWALKEIKKFNNGKTSRIPS